MQKACCSSPYKLARNDTTARHEIDYVCSEILEVSFTTDQRGRGRGLTIRWNPSNLRAGMIIGFIFALATARVDYRIMLTSILLSGLLCLSIGSVEAVVFSAPFLLPINGSPKLEVAPIGVS